MSINWSSVIPALLMSAGMWVAFGPRAGGITAIVWASLMILAALWPKGRKR